MAGGLTDFNQYSNAKPYMGALPAWVDGIDAERLAAYNFYERMYWSIPDAFKLMQHGTDTNPIYIPSSKTIIETINRFLAPKLKIIPDPALGSDLDKQNANVWMQSFLRRERFFSNFNVAKRDGLKKGDWLFHLYADPAKPEGSRVSIFGIDPSKYFPIYNNENQNVDDVIGAQLVEYVTPESGDPYIYRLQYLEIEAKVQVSIGTYKIEDWRKVDATPIQTIVPTYFLDPRITHAPVYHIPNFKETGSIWGSSEIRGLEVIAGAINQSITDEDLTLVLDGLGVYATDAGTPVDPDTGEATSWNIGPGSVLELPPTTTFSRVSGVSAVTPWQEHLQYLHNQMDESAGTNPAARGNIDVQTAESGVALMLELGPLLAKVEEKEQIITDVLNNMFFDLKAWFEVYEGQNFNEAVWIPTFGEKLPINRKEKFAEITSLYTAGVVSLEWVWQELSKIGYESFDATNMMSQILGNKQMIGTVEADVMGAQIDSEIAAQQQPADATTPPPADATAANAN